jgi:hypothetical protein
MATLLIKKQESKYVEFHTIEIGTVFTIDNYHDDVYMKIHSVEDLMKGQSNLEVLYNAVSLVDFHIYEIDDKDEVLVYSAELDLRLEKGCD